MATPAYAMAPPPYFGGKSQVLRWVFNAIAGGLPRASWQSATFVDAFHGGGSVALAAKRHGFRVLANDLAERSVLVGEALLVNDRVVLTAADEQRLHAPHLQAEPYIAERFVPDFFLEGHARWLDNAFAHAASTADAAKRQLIRLVLMHAILRIRPFADFARTEVTQRFAEGDYDAIRSLSIGGIKRLINLTPSRLIEGLCARVNAGVFSNGRGGHAIHRGDALDFVGAVEGEVLYLDPPYFGSNAYEAVYRTLDQILEHREQPRERSAFNQAGAIELLDALLARAAHFPVWVLSFGGGKVTHEQCLALVQRHRPARLMPIAIRYVYGTASHGDSGRRSEILIVARREGWA